MLGKASISGEKKKEIDSFKDAFPGLTFADEEEEEINSFSSTEDYKILYIWDISKPLFDVFEISRTFTIDEFYTLDSAILLSLINDKHLPITQSLNLIRYIHSEYITVLLEHRKSEYDRREDS